MPTQDVVVDDDPLGGRGDRRGAVDDLDVGCRVRDGQLARPVALDRCRAHDQPASAGREMPQRHDRLARLAEAHVVGENRAPPAEQKRDAVDLVREEPFGERHRALERRLVVAGQREQLCERRRLRVERVGHERTRGRRIFPQKPPCWCQSNCGFLWHRVGGFCGKVLRPPRAAVRRGRGIRLSVEGSLTTPPYVDDAASNRLIGMQSGSPQLAGDGGNGAFRHFTSQPGPLE